MGSTTELRRELKNRFWPYAAARGFVIDASLQPRTTVFRRDAGDRVQIFALDWDKYGTPRFTLHFGTCPLGGLEINGRVISPDRTLPTWCRDAGTLQPRRGFGTRSWFRQDRTMLERLLGGPAFRSAIEVVEQFLALFPEVERYWSSGEVGPHIRTWRRY